MSGGTSGGTSGGSSGGAAGGNPTAGGFVVVNDGGFGYPSRVPNPTCLAPPRPSTNSGVQFSRVFPSLTFNAPAALMQPPGDSSQIFVMDLSGTVVAFPNITNPQPAQLRTVISIPVDTGGPLGTGEGGLLGMAFHPQWTSGNRKELFLSYTRTGAPLISVISRFRSTDNGQTFDPATEERLFQINQPATNHNGGNIAFGPDGFLYAGFGDGGGSDDTFMTGQALNTNLGKFIRIDVETPFLPDGGGSYRIPPTNPFADGGTPCNLTSRALFAGTGVRCAEIYATGLRNPWRWSFDRASGVLWAGDVGQSTWEEVDTIVSGGNYGWSICEGFHRRGSSSALCNTPGLIDPVVALDRSQAWSITGGFVYRGSAAPSMVGRYVFADYANGFIYSVREDPMTGARSIETLGHPGGNVPSFGQTNDGELYVLTFAGTVFQLLATPATDAGAPFPPTLSATGCFTASTPTQPVSALIPFAVNAPLWSDGAQKERFFAIPDGTQITVQADGDFDFPNGTVTAKTFSLNGQKIETRLFVKHSDGQWGGYSYEWRTDQTDADLLPSNKSKVVGSQTWYYPSRSECLQCHTVAAGRSLGLEIAQLNGNFTYPGGRTANQVETLAALGYFSSALPNVAATLPRLVDPGTTTATPHDRARSYLHANCSGCHRNGLGRGPADFRFSQTVPQMNLCGISPTTGNAGVPGALLMTAGTPALSLISIRPRSLSSTRMPPLGTSIVDTQGTAVIDAWISGVTSCP